MTSGTKELPTGIKLPQEIEDRLKKWHNNAARLRGINLILGVSAIVSSVTVASRLFVADSLIMSVIAWLAAISSALLTSMNLETKSNHNREAWRILNIACERYKTETNYTIDQLNAEYEKGEKAISNFEVKLH